MNLKTLLSILFTAFVSICLGQSRQSKKGNKQPIKIDEIENTKQHRAFVKPFLKDHYDYFKINDPVKFDDKNCQWVADSLQTKPFIKADIDGNGLTDLLVMVGSGDHYIVCILDSGNSKIAFKHLTINHEECSFPLIDTVEGGTLINLIGFKEIGRRNNEELRTIVVKKLIYKWGDFIEYNGSPKDLNIQKIEYSTTMCFGTCPKFAITINSDRTARYDAFQFNKPDGKFSGIIDESHFIELVEALNYSNFPSLADNYKVLWTDDQHCTLIVTYGNGKTKTIHDYGLIGTYGLRKVYDLLFNLRKNQNWE